MSVCVRLLESILQLQNTSTFELTSYPLKQCLKFVSVKCFHHTIFYPSKLLFKQVSGLYYSSFSPLLEISHRFQKIVFGIEQCLFNKFGSLKCALFPCKALRKGLEHERNVGGNTT